MKRKLSDGNNSHLQTTLSPPLVHSDLRRNRQEDYTFDEPHNSAMAVPNRSGGPSSVLEETLPYQAPNAFAKNASIIIIGVRGSGKTTLALMASTALRRRLLDADLHFKRVTGHSTASYIQGHGVIQFRVKELEILTSILAENKTDCVIACGSGCVEGRGQDLIRQYARTNPIIHVVRDSESIQKYLGIESDKVSRLLAKREPVFRYCSNLEFYNISDTAPERTEDEENFLQKKVLGRKLSIAPSLTLKRTELDFLRFINFTLGHTSYQTTRDPLLPLSSISLETRPYTYALSLPMSMLENSNLDIGELDSTADLLELKYEFSEITNHMQLGRLNPEFISRQLAIIRRGTTAPINFHIELQGTAWRNSEKQYLDLIRHGLRLGAEYLTVDLNCNDEFIRHVVAHKGRTRIIGNFFEPRCDSGDWSGTRFMEIYVRAANLGCDLVRLSKEASDLEDNWAVQQFRQRVNNLPRPRPPLIAFNTGPLGRISRCLNPILTSVTHSSLQIPASLPPYASITIHEAQQALHTSFVLDKMRFYIFGSKVKFSLSPAMHNAAYRAYGMPHEYSMYEAKSLRELEPFIEDPHFGGASISLPYKTEVMALLHSMSTHARVIGAVNTIVPIRDSLDLRDSFDPYTPRQHSLAGPVIALYGDNTDWIGIRTCILRNLSPANAIANSTTGLVIGAGGMARAAVYAMIQLGIQHILVYNRTLANAENLAQHYNRQSDLSRRNTSGSNNAGDLPWSRPSTPIRDNQQRVTVIKSLQEPWPAGIRQPTIIVSCIPAYDTGSGPPASFQIPTHWLQSSTGGVVIELSYKTLNTPLMQQIQQLSHRGWVAVSGLEMLPEQGYAQFELWTGRKAPRKLMRMEVLRNYRDDEEQNDASS